MPVKTVSIQTSRNQKNGFFSSKDSDIVNDNELASNIENSCNDLVASGYTIISVMPIISGANNVSGYGNYGYSYTSAVIITAIKA